MAVGLRMQRDPFAQCRLVGNQPVAPALDQVQRGTVAPTATVLLAHRVADRLQHRLLELAHQLADELQLTPPALKIRDGPGVVDGIAKLFRQGERLDLAGTQLQQILAELLQLGAFALELGSTRRVTALEFALELEVQFAAFGDELTGDEIASFWFAGHGGCGRWNYAPGAEHGQPSIIAVDMTSSKNKSAPSHTEKGFAYSRATFQDLVDQAMRHARSLGATDSAAEASEACGLSVSVRKGELENVERNRDKSLSVTVYLGQRRGNANTSDFSAAAIRQTVQAAYDIARFTAQDPMAGLPDEADIAAATADAQVLDLFHPWALTSEAAAELAFRCEQAAFDTSSAICNSEGAGVSAQQSHFFSAHSHGFSGGFASSRHSMSVAPIAGSGDAMQRDAWYSSMLAAADMASPQSIGRYAAQRTLSRLGARKISTRQCPVLFESPLAAGLLGSFVQAISGGALYRQSSFLLDSLGKQVLPQHIDIDEDPFVRRGKGSSPFDDEGVRVAARRVVDAGRVRGYFLSSYTARKLGMRTTGNAGGSHNLVLRSRLTRPTDDLDAMLRQMGRGLFVTELMGQGVNYVTGDYSRGASGFWVENGQIAYPVHEITIAGNMKKMLKDLVAVGADSYNYGAKTVGSVLIGKMKVAGS